MRIMLMPRRRRFLDAVISSDCCFESCFLIGTALMESKVSKFHVEEEVHGDEESENKCC